MSNEKGFDLSRQLKSAVRKRIGSTNGPRPRASQAAYHLVFIGATKPGLRARLESVAPSRAAAGLAAAVLAVGGGSLAAAAATGSSDPAVWGRTVTAAVEQCKDQLPNGIHGIGDCVSRVARQNGEDARADHSHGKSGQDHGNGPDRGNGNEQGNGTATGRPSGAPGGPPSGAPEGPKKNHPAPPSPPGHR